MRKIKSFLGNMKKKIVIGATIATVTIMSAMPVMASEASTDVSIVGALETGLSNTVVDMFSYLAVALPVGLTAFGAFFGIKKVMGFFRSVAK